MACRCDGMADIQDLKFHFRTFIDIERHFFQVCFTAATIGRNALFPCRQWFRGSNHKSSTESSTREFPLNRCITRNNDATTGGERKTSRH